MPCAARRNDCHVLHPVLTVVRISFPLSFFAPWWCTWFFDADCLVRRIDPASGAEDTWPWLAAFGFQPFLRARAGMPWVTPKTVAPWASGKKSYGSTGKDTWSEKGSKGDQTYPPWSNKNKQWNNKGQFWSDEGKASGQNTFWQCANKECLFPKNIMHMKDCLKCKQEAPKRLL